MKLEVKNVACGYGGKTVASGLSLAVSSGESLCLLGPNGVGKTTFFKTILGLLELKAGKILLDNEDIGQWSRRQFATRVGYVPQAHNAPFPFKVADVVLMGRTAHLPMFTAPVRKDREIAAAALDTLGILPLKDRIYTEISGGERQLVLIARALAQQPEFLIMDEPTANLDFGNQIKVLQQIKKLVREKNMGILMTTHFPNHAFFCSSQVAVMGRDNTFTVGQASEVITEEYLKKVYDVDVRILKVGEKDGGTTVCVPLAGD